MSILGSFTFIGISDLDLAAGSEGPAWKMGYGFWSLARRSLSDGCEGTPSLRGGQDNVVLLHKVGGSLLWELPPASGEVGPDRGLGKAQGRRAVPGDRLLKCVAGGPSSSR